MADSNGPPSLSSSRAPTDDFWEVIYSQRAIRYWTPEPVPRNLLERVVEAATKAPSGSNTQPWIFIVVDEPNKLKPIAEALRLAAADLVDSGRVPPNPDAAEDRSMRLILKGARAFFGNLESAPAVIVPCLYRHTSPNSDPDSLLAGSSIYPAVQNMLLAARALGLGTVMTTAQHLIEETVRETLGIPEDAHPAAFIPIGYPDANFGPTNRKPVEDVIRFNSWG